MTNAERIQANNEELQECIDKANALPNAVTDAVLYTEQVLSSEQQAQARENIGALEADALPTAIDTALAQAKASGEFKGNPGKTPVKGVDYYTEADKAEMVDAVIAALPDASEVKY